MLRLAGRLMREEEGQGMTEYALVLGVIAIATIALVTVFRDQLQSAWQSITDGLGSALEESVSS